MALSEYGVDEVKDPLDAKSRADLQAKHGELITIDIKGNLCVFRLPKRAEVRRYRQKISEKGVHADDEMEKLLKACVVQPAPEKFEELLERYSMALGSAGIAFMAGSGFDFSQTAVVK